MARAIARGDAPDFTWLQTSRTNAPSYSCGPAVGPTPVSQLSQLLGTTQPAISQTLREMERDELVDFGPGEDRRVRLASLSPKGEALCRQLEPVWNAVGRGAADLGTEVGVDLPALLLRLLAALDQKPFATRIEERLN